MSGGWAGGITVSIMDPNATLHFIFCRVVHHGEHIITFSLIVESVYGEICFETPRVSLWTIAQDEHFFKKTQSALPPFFLKTLQPSQLFEKSNRQTISNSRWITCQVFVPYYHEIPRAPMFGILDFIHSLFSRIFGYAMMISVWGRQLPGKVIVMFA
jgi:hypothetical protein